MFRRAFEVFVLNSFFIQFSFQSQRFEMLAIDASIYQKDHLGMDVNLLLRFDLSVMSVII